MKFRRRLDELGRLDDNSLEDFAAHRNSFDESHIAYLDMNLTSINGLNIWGKLKSPRKIGLILKSSYILQEPFLLSYKRLWVMQI
jgi:hypothetical protein